jgi:hypothetical protein
MHTLLYRAAKTLDPTMDWSKNRPRLNNPQKNSKKTPTPYCSNQMNRYLRCHLTISLRRIRVQPGTDEAEQ